jgi:MFS family permease
MSETAGLFLGSLSGGWLYVGAGAASPFLFEAGCMALGSLAVARRSVPSSNPPRAAARPARGRLRAALGIRGVPLLSLTSAALTAIQTGLIVFLFPLYAIERAGASPEMVGLLVSAGVLGRLCALWLGGRAPDRARRLQLLMPGLLAYAALLALLGVLTHPLALLLWSGAAGAAAGLIVALPAALIGDVAPPALQGVAIGWLRTVTDTGQILGPLGLGGLADHVGLPQTFRWGAGLLLAAAAGCWTLGRGPRTRAASEAP